MTEKPFLVSGRNTLIHKIRKLDLLVVNGEDHPPVVVTHKGIKEYAGSPFAPFKEPLGWI